MPVRSGYAAVRGGYAAVRRYGVLIGGAFPKASQFRVCRIRWSLVEVGTCASQPDTLGGVVKSRSTGQHGGCAKEPRHLCVRARVPALGSSPVKSQGEEGLTSARPTRQHAPTGHRVPRPDNRARRAAQLVRCAVAGHRAGAPLARPHGSRPGVARCHLASVRLPSGVPRTRGERWQRGGARGWGGRARPARGADSQGPARCGAGGSHRLPPSGARSAGAQRVSEPPRRRGARVARLAWGEPCTIAPPLASPTLLIGADLAATSRSAALLAQTVADVASAAGGAEHACFLYAHHERRAVYRAADGSIRLEERDEPLAASLQSLEERRLDVGGVALGSVVACGKDPFGKLGRVRRHVGVSDGLWSA